jgi:beta-lactamase regulating signal transducer with metallopeptidase domain
LRHGLWILLLVKLVTPPLVAVDLQSTWAWTARLASPPDRNTASTGQTSAAIEVCVVDQPATAVMGAAPIPFDVNGSPAGSTTSSLRDERAPNLSQTSNALACESPNGVSATGRTGSASTIASPSWWSTLPWASIVRALVAVWLIGAVSMAVVTVARLVWFARQLARFGQRSSELETETAEIVRRLGRTRTPRTRLVRGVVSPMLFGVGPWTTLLFPEELFHKLSREARGTLLLHEIAHMCRGDHWVRPLECVATVMYWWHPAVWWSLGEIEASEEECCDHWVMQRLDAPRRCYAEALMDTIDFLCERQAMLPPVASGLGNPRELRERLTRIMRGGQRGLIGLTGRIAIVLVLAGLPMQPTAFASVTGLFRAGFDSGESTTAALDTSILPAPVVPNIAVDSLRPRDASLRAPHSAPMELVTTPAFRAVREWGKSVSTDGRFEVVRLGGGRLELRDRVSARVTKLDDWSISAVDFVPGESRFLSAGFDRQIRLWDAESGRMLRTYAERADAAVSISAADGTRTFAVGTRGGELAMFRVDDTAPLRSKQFDGPVNCVRFSPAGDRLVVGLGDWREDGAGSGAVAVLDMNLAEESPRIGMDRAIGSVGWTDQSDVVAAADWTGGVVYHNLVTGARLAGIKISKDQVSSASFSGRGAAFPAHTVDEAIALERETTVRPIRELAAGYLGFPAPATRPVNSSGIPETSAP